MASETVTSVRPRRRKSKRRRTIVIAGLVVALAAGGYVAYRLLHKSGSAAIQYTTQAAQKVTIIQSISGTGSVNLNSSTTVSPEVTGTVTGLSVGLGDEVKKGQVLFTLVNEDLDKAVLQATNSYNQAVNSLSNAEISLEKAQKSLEDLRYKRSQQQWGDLDDGRVALASLNVTPPSTTTTSAHPSTTTTTQPKNTTTTISELDIRVAEQQVTSAELSVTVAQTNVTLAKMALDQAKKDVTKREVTAPQDGTITEINVADGDSVGSSSSAGQGSTGIMVITDLGSWDITVTLAEADIGGVRAEQKATISFDALPDLSLTGKVSVVPPTGTNSSGVVSYTATVVPDLGNAEVKGGMTATVNIITTVAADVIGVPIAAVKSATDGTKYVQILQDGKPVNQTVEVGISNETYTQITSGLAEGQEVVTRTVNPNASTTTARSGGNILNGNTGGVPGGGVIQGGGGPPAGTPGN